MRLPSAAWLPAFALLALPACGDPTAQTPGDADAGEDDAPAPDGICGDGLVNAPHEACDDANDREGDGCNSDCRASGERVWCLDDFGPADADALPTALAVGPSGDVAVIGRVYRAGEFTAWLEVVDASGAPRWSTRFTNTGGAGVGFLSDGTLAVALHEAGSSSSSIALFSAEGTPGSSWTGESGQTIYPGVFAVSSQDRIIAAGRTEIPDEAWVGAFSASLALERQATYRSSQGISTSARAVAAGRAGTIILGADVILDAGSDAISPPTTAAIASLLPSGELAWDHVFESTNPLLNLASVASMADGSVVATGATGSTFSYQVWMASLSAAGEVNWEHTAEDVPSPSAGSSITPASTPDFLLTSSVSRERPFMFTAVFSRYDHERRLLWERDYAVAEGGTSAQLSARSGADRSFLLAGFLNPPETDGARRPWLCKYTE
jgi:cysteine-rich repeat protein